MFRVRAILGMFLLAVVLTGQGQACLLDCLHSSINDSCAANDTNSGDDTTDSASVNLDLLTPKKALSIPIRIDFGLKIELPKKQIDSPAVCFSSDLPLPFSVKTIFISQAGLMPRAPSLV